MLSRKSSILFASTYTNLSPLYYSHTSAASPAACPPSCRHTFSPVHVARQTRCYAQHTKLPPHPHGHDADLLSWPEAVKPQTIPSPYQILRCAKGDVYTKNSFYALVKLYHPDRCHPSSTVAHLPLQIRLERYRLLVAAHDLLSDADKRRAYDAWGMGWHNVPATHHHPYTWESDQRRGTTDPRYNATWEDWERWYSENDGSKDSGARTLQLSNFAFMSLLFAFVSIGGVLQGTRFTSFNNSVADRRDQIHREASMELRRSQNATMSGDREERIRTFLEHREANILGEPSYHRLLPPSDNCAPDATRRE
jgi:curved DNA-binding protein CbpA